LVNIIKKLKETEGLIFFCFFIIFFVWTVFFFIVERELTIHSIAAIAFMALMASQFNYESLKAKIRELEKKLEENVK